MVDRPDDDDVIVLASFNIHRSQGRRARRRNFITISDDSDEEPVPLDPNSPVLVSDKPDDDVSILEPLNPARRHVIRPAALWGVASEGDGPIIELKEVDGHRTAPLPSTSQSRDRDASAPSSSQSRDRDASAPSTSQSRDASAPSTSQYRDRDAPSTSQYRDRDASAPSTSQYRDTSAPSTSQYRDRDASAPSTSQYRDPSAPSTSQYRDTSAPSTSQYRDTFAPSTSQYRDRDTSAPSTSQYRDTSAPSTSTQTRHQPFTRPVLQEVKLVLLPQVQPPAPPQPHARPRSPQQQLHPGPLNQPPLSPQALLLTQAFQIQQPRSLHPQPVPQVAPQPVPAPQRCPAGPYGVPAPAVLIAAAPQRCPAGPCGVPAPAVLIAAAPERLGLPETGHRITLGSQTLGGLNPQSGGLLLTHDRPLSLEPQVVVVVNRPATQPPLPIPALAVPLNPNPIVPAPVVPRTAEERAGPSEDQQEVQGPETPQLQPHVRALVRGVVDLFPDVQENYVAELIQTNDLKDLNVICNMLLENPAFPQRESSAAAAQSSMLLEPCNDNSQSVEDLFDYGSLGQVGSEAAMQAADLLMGDFRMISCQDIKWSLNAMKGHYAITRKALCEAVKQFQDSESLEKRRPRRQTAERCYIDFKYQHGSVKLERRMYFLEKNRRGCRTYGAALDPSLQREITFYQQKAKEHAEVRGWVEEEKMTIDFSIGENTTEGRTHMMCIQGTDGCENPKPCQSQLTVLEYGYYDGDPVTKVMLQPLTGRTHQLRVHCEAVGHPIVGDHTYSLGEDSAPYRMMLHAHLLHLPLEPLPLQAAAPDPFTTPTDPRWRPQRCLRTVEGVVETLLEHRVAGERTEREERRRQQEERRRQQEERRKRWRGREESEEQRRMCQQWLSEWTDV